MLEAQEKHKISCIKMKGKDQCKDIWSKQHTILIIHKWKQDSHLCQSHLSNG